MHDKESLKEKFALFSPRSGEKLEMDPLAIISKRESAFGQTYLVHVKADYKRSHALFCEGRKL